MLLSPVLSPGQATPQESGLGVQKKPNIDALFFNKRTQSLMNSHCRAPTMMSFGVPKLQLPQLEHIRSPQGPTQVLRARLSAARDQARSPVLSHLGDTLEQPEDSTSSPQTNPATAHHGFADLKHRLLIMSFLLLCAPFPGDTS